MDKKYYIEIESLRSGKYYRDEHSSNSPTFQEITDAYLWSTKDYSDYFHKAIGTDAFRRIQVANVDLPAGCEIVLKMEDTLELKESMFMFF